MDGTLSSASMIFKELYVIRAPIGNSTITCVYGLLSGMSQEVYEEFFRAIVKKREESGFRHGPLTVISDFEQVVIRAIESILGSHVTACGCFYHLSQSTWGKVQERRLADLYDI